MFQKAVICCVIVYFMKKELAELVGILLGDGSIGVYKSIVNGKEKTQYRIKITLNAIKDADYADYVSDLMQLVFGKRPIKTKRKFENTLDLCLFGRKHIELLLRIGMKLSPKWQRATIPKQFFTPTLSKLVLRGCIDTDGCVSNVYNNGIRYPRIELKICPSPMQSQLVNLLDFHGFKPQVTIMCGGEARVAICGLKKLQRWVNKIGFSNKRNLVAAAYFLPELNSGGRI